MTAISGRKMGKSLEATVRRYYELGVLEGESFAAVSAAVTRLKMAKDRNSWDYSISKGDPIKFKECIDHRDNSTFNPLIMAESISVDTNAEFPYREWVAVLVLEYRERGKTSPRWHFDLGNAGQSGPRLHLQYGGHHHEERILDETLKAPRWSNFPLDVILLMEVVAANFFEDVWKDRLRDDRSLRNYTKLSERLCYAPLSQKLNSYLDDIAGVEADNTFLSGCWNDRWA
ncbi:hypothetical protein ACGYK6_08700 [Sulfitobacter sp. 1A15333]|uniref:hypothetical protein n=1 Tax=Sulfitobacter sp. 1A15333 TaxID=3368570 RepID=UPI0037461F53